MQIHPPVPKCETQSHDDVKKMWTALLKLCHAMCICVVIICDGQLVELLRTEKRLFPHEYKRILISNGPFHSLSHFCFTQNEGFWKVPRRTLASRRAAPLPRSRSVIDVT